MLYTLTVPSTVRRWPIPRSAFKTRVRESMIAVCQITGGVTAVQDGLGAWLDASGNLVTESVVILQTYADESARDKLETLARKMARDYSQDSILFTVESVPVFVTEKIA